MRSGEKEGGRTARWADEEVDEREEKESPSMAPKAMGEQRPVAKGRRIGNGGGDSATFEVLLRSPGSPTCCGSSLLLIVVIVKRSTSLHDVNRRIRRPRNRDVACLLILSIDSMQSADEADLQLSPKLIFTIAVDIWKMCFLLVLLKDDEV